ncbi:MAG TPA: hypothetical protein VIJ76_00220, partial [Galbitalea sp.]
MTAAKSLIRMAPLVVLVAVLAGCAAPVPTPTHSSAGARPTPTATAAAHPGSRVPLKCADLFTPATVAALVGAPVTISRDESTPPAYLDDVANAQLGVLPCQWVGGDAFEAGYTANVSVYIAPDSSAGFVANLSADLAEHPAQSAPPILNSAGDKSGYWCEAAGVSGDSPECRGQMLVGSYWVSVILSAVAPATAAIATANTQKILATVATRLRAAGSPKTTVWATSASTPPGFCTDPNATSQVRTIFAAPRLTLYPGGKRTFDASSIALDGLVAECNWTDPGCSSGTVDIELLAGGAWVFPGFAPVPSVDGFVRSYSPVTIPGASSALMGCDSGFC